MEKCGCCIRLDFSVLYQLGKQGLPNFQQLQMLVQGTLVRCLPLTEDGMIGRW